MITYQGSHDAGLTGSRPTRSGAIQRQYCEVHMTTIMSNIQARPYKVVLCLGLLIYLIYVHYSSYIHEFFYFAGHLVIFSINLFLVPENIEKDIT